MASIRSWTLPILRLFFITAGLSAVRQPVVTCQPLPSDWNALNQTVQGRLFLGVPFAQPCFAAGFNSTDCLAVRSSYLTEVARTNVPGAYMETQWETCQTTGDGCLLSYTNPNNTTPTLAPNQCLIGSIPEHFIDVRNAQDVAAAFTFSKTTKVPLVIKNTGHDYKGRSSAPHSLALWTHNLKAITYNPAFIPEGGSTASPGVTVGAGVQWGEAYAFAEANGITVVGGSDQTVGVSGGWLQGGGHSTLSNTMGLGVDRVLQFKVVTPDGVYRTANAHQNTDLYFALRGGGGGTFGVVLESTILASPPVTLQAVIVAFSPNTTRTKELWTIVTDNGLKWANEGWGGFVQAGFVILVNPKLSKSETATSMAPLIQYSQLLQSENVAGASTTVAEFSTFGAFFNTMAQTYSPVAGASLTGASRMVSKNNLATPANSSALVSAFLAAEAATPGLLIMLTTPFSFPSNGQTSVTDAWRSSVYHVAVNSNWEWNATIAQKKQHYAAVSASIDNLRRITPDAAYQNECDVYEPNHEVTFWGSHYKTLLRIKQKYDPDRLLDCWHCVGWNPKSPRFRCYL